MKKIIKTCLFLFALTRITHGLLNDADNFRTVEEGKLYRSAQLSAKTLEKYILDYHIKTVINLRGEQKTHQWWLQEKKITEKHQVAFHNLDMDSSQLPTRQHLITLLDLYQTAQHPTLIHCLHGINRTGLAAGIWVLDQQGKNKKEALKQLDQQKHPQKSKQAFFINLWQSSTWARTQYDPADYPAHPSPKQSIKKNKKIAQSTKLSRHTKMRAGEKP